MFDRCWSVPPKKIKKYGNMSGSQNWQFGNNLNPQRPLNIYKKNKTKKNKSSPYLFAVFWALLTPFWAHIELQNYPKVPPDPPKGLPDHPRQLWLGSLPNGP